jgi:hypothetical protein
VNKSKRVHRRQVELRTCNCIYGKKKCASPVVTGLAHCRFCLSYCSDELSHTDVKQEIMFGDGF